MINPANWKQLDREYKNQKKKYKNPLPSREFILEILREMQRPVFIASFVRKFKLGKVELEKGLVNRLKAMIREGQLEKLKDHSVRQVRTATAPATVKKNKTAPLPIQTGRVIGHPNGYGFFAPDDGQEDGFLPPDQMQGLMHDDQVRAQVSFIEENGRQEYQVLEVIRRGHSQLVGQFDKKLNLVNCASKNINVNIEVLRPLPRKVRDGQFVRVEISDYGGAGGPVRGHITEVIGDGTTKNIKNEIALINYNLPSAFPEPVRQQCAKIPDELQPKDYENRRDMRNLPFVTIDGADARDFDDAVYAKASGDNYLLYVAIADVSHYVQPATALDLEAYQRATSIYFPNQVVPMLPEKLSNGLCSINPHCDRLALVAAISIRADGEISRCQFYNAVIHSHRRFTYEEAEALIFQGKKDKQLDKKLGDSLAALKKIYELRLKQRQERGALDFDFPEAAFSYGPSGEITGISAKHRLESHKLIEEMMVAANVCAAKLLQRRKLPGLFRNHEAPEGAQLEVIRNIARQAKMKLPKEIDTKAVAALLAKVSTLPDGTSWEFKLLFSMNQALYATENKGHFGLALAHYCHFTSPIRRYPDLLVHRAIKAHLARRRYQVEDLAERAKHCSDQERRADEVSRDVVKSLKCDYLAQHGEQIFSGRISRIKSMGLFVTLDDLFIDGLIHVRSYQDRLNYDEASETMINENSGHRYKLGDPLQVQVLAIDSAAGRIDFVEVLPKRAPKTKQAAKKSPAKAAKAKAEQSKAPAKSKPKAKSAKAAAKPKGATKTAAKSKVAAQAAAKPARPAKAPKAAKTANRSGKKK